MNSSQELIDAIRGYAPGSRVEVRASRDGWVKQLTLNLAKRQDVSGTRQSQVLPPVGQQSERTTLPRGFADPAKAKKIYDPYYRARYSRW